MCVMLNDSWNVYVDNLSVIQKSFNAIEVLLHRISCIEISKLWNSPSDTITRFPLFCQSARDGWHHDLKVLMDRQKSMLLLLCCCLLYHYTSQKCCCSLHFVHPLLPNVVPLVSAPTVWSHMLSSHLTPNKSQPP